MNLDSHLANLQSASVPVPITYSPKELKEKIAVVLTESLHALAAKTNTLIAANVKKFILIEGELYHGSFHWKPNGERDQYRIDSITLCDFNSGSRWLRYHSDTLSQQRPEVSLKENGFYLENPALTKTPPSIGTFSRCMHLDVNPYFDGENASDKATMDSNYPCQITGRYPEHLRHSVGGRFDLTVNEIAKAVVWRLSNNQKWNYELEELARIHSVVNVKIAQLNESYAAARQAL